MGACIIVTQLVVLKSGFCWRTKLLPVMEGGQLRTSRSPTTELTLKRGGNKLVGGVMPNDWRPTRGVGVAGGAVNMTWNNREAPYCEKLEAQGIQTQPPQGEQAAASHTRTWAVITVPAGELGNVLAPPKK